MSRRDGRTPAQIRPLACEQAVLNRADGSCRFSQGQTSVLVAVYGPADVKVNKEKLDRATVEVQVRPKTGLAGYRERSLERIFRTAVESFVLTQLHPRTSITIVVQIMQDAGSLMACALNGIAMACVDAGLPMNGMLCATSCCILPAGELCLDGDHVEEREARAVATFACNTASPGLVVSSQVEGILSEEELLRCTGAGQRAAQSVHAFMKLSIERKLGRQHHIGA